MALKSQVGGAPPYAQERHQYSHSQCGKATQHLTDIRAACGPEPFPISIPDSVARVLSSCRALGAVELTGQCLRVKVFDKSFIFYFAKPLSLSLRCKQFL